jgi:hypothetical protein
MSLAGFRRLLSVSTGRPAVRVAGPAPAPRATGAEEMPAFITPQSILNFPVASLVVTVMWKVLGRVVESWRDSELLSLILAIIVGMFIYYIGLTGNIQRRDRTIGFGIAIINSFLLAASALGINVTLSG